jgi:hypothetical protein
MSDKPKSPIEDEDDTELPDDWNDWDSDHWEDYFAGPIPDEGFDPDDVYEPDDAERENAAREEGSSLENPTTQQRARQRRELSAHAARLLDLRRKEKEIKTEIQQVSEKIVAEVGVGTTVSVENLRVQVHRQRLVLRIVDRQLVPERFLSLQPDRGQILAHARQTGEEVAGAEVSEARAAVIVKEQGGSE